MISAFISRLVIIIFGLLYPAYASYKAVRTKNVKEYVKWMMYWIVFALFMCAEIITDIFLSFWFPFYYEIKIMLLLWLLSPATKGSSILYRKFVHPMLSRREQEIDEYIARAKEQSYHTVLHLGTRGVNYATTVIMQTAIKGGGGLVQQLRRSYSLGDLSSDTDGTPGGGRKAVPESSDRPRERERAATTTDGRLRPRGHSPRRSASGSGRVEMYFPEVDVDVRGSSVREPSVLLSQIRSSEDVSSGYSSAEPLYQQGSGGQVSAGRPDALASTREPLVRTASVGGSTRSTRTRGSRAGTAVTKRSAATTVTEDDEGGEEDSLNPCSSPRSRSNSLPMSVDLLRPELVALLQALNAELVQKVSQSKMSEPAENITNSEDTEKVENGMYCDAQNMAEIQEKVNPCIVSDELVTEVTSNVNVNESCKSETTFLDSDDTFYDTISDSSQSITEGSTSGEHGREIKDEKNSGADVSDPDLGSVTIGSLAIPISPVSIDKDSPPGEKQNITNLSVLIVSAKNNPSANTEEAVCKFSNLSLENVPTNEINLDNKNSSPSNMEQCSVETSDLISEPQEEKSAILPDDMPANPELFDYTSSDQNEGDISVQSVSNNDIKQSTVQLTNINDLLSANSEPLTTSEYLKSDGSINLEIVCAVPAVSSNHTAVKNLSDISSSTGNTDIVSSNSQLLSKSPKSRTPPKKDTRSGKYNKLQAPEPPPRSRGSSERSSMSEEGEMASGHRSRSPRKVIESTAAKLHGQIESLTAMLPFWQNGKHLQPAGERGFRIREMSRSPSRRSRGQPSV